MTTAPMIHIAPDPRLPDGQVVSLTCRGIGNDDCESTLHLLTAFTLGATEQTQGLQQAIALDYLQSLKHESELTVTLSICEAARSTVVSQMTVKVLTSRQAGMARTIGSETTLPRNLRTAGRTFCEAWLTWDRPVEFSYMVEYEITCPGREPVRTSALEFIATGLIPEKEYLFKVQLRTEVPLPVVPASISVVTHDRVPPTRPGELKLTLSAPGSATLGWRASEDNVGVSGYEVRRQGGAWIPVSETGYLVTGASDGSPDTFEVRARDAAGNYSPPASLTSELLIKPTIPGVPVASNITSTSALLTWRPPTNTAGVITYWIALDGAAPVLSAQNSYLFTDLKDDTPYTVVVNAVSAAGIVSNPNSGTFRTLDITKPTQPSGLVAVDVSSRAVAFLWTRASDNVGVTHYEILEEGRVIATTQDSAPAFLATGLTAGTLYSFAVQALDVAGNRSEPSVAITVKTAPVSAPKNARTTVSHNRIDLVWDRPDDALGLLGYRVEVTSHNGSDRKVETPVRSVALLLLKPSTEYTVSISAHDASQFYGEALTFKVTTNAN